MAIYHLSMQIVSRSKGQSAVAAAAYRSGEKIKDERTGEEKFYRRDVKPETMIFTPKNAPEWVQDRERLWNEVEKAEIRKDSQLAREINVALPVELSNEHQKELISSFVQEQFVDKGMIADVSIHRDDKENPHAHVMLTMRSIDENGFGKKNRDWNADFANAKENTRGFVKSSENCLDIREEWSNHVNKALESKGIQERISHLSHEARGLEQIPTVHLGQVINDMEKRGLKTDRGDINRDRQEYNALVVDLQKYREEKQAIERENERKQSSNERLKEIVNDYKEKFINKVEEEKPVEQTNTRQDEPQKTVEEKQTVKQENILQHEPQVTVKRINTQEELTHLQEAKKSLKAEPSLENIQERRLQIDKWENRKQSAEQFIKWKDETIKQASQHHQTIASTQTTIKEQQQRLENINWLNPLKIKENRAIKEQAERYISSSQKEIEKLDTKLDYHREKLGFKTEDEFKQIQKEFAIEKPGLLEKNKKVTHQISQERDTLKNAETAIKTGVRREVVTQYPQHPEMRYISYKTASEIKKMNEQAGKVIPLENIQTDRNKNINELQGLNKELRFVETEKVRLERTDGYLKEVDKYNAIIERYDKNPLLKGKLLISKTAKQEYGNAVSKRDNYNDLMKEKGVSGRDDWNKQSRTFEKVEAKVPFIQSQMKPVTRNLGILDAMLQGIEQASQESKKQQMQKRGQTKGKGKFKGQSMDEGLERGR